MVDGRAVPVAANVIQEEVMYDKVSKKLPNTAITQQHTGVIACKLFSGTHKICPLLHLILSCAPSPHLLLLFICDTFSAAMQSFLLPITIGMDVNNNGVYTK